MRSDTLHPVPICPTTFAPPAWFPSPLRQSSTQQLAHLLPTSNAANPWDLTIQPPASNSSTSPLPNHPAPGATTGPRPGATSIGGPVLLTDTVAAVATTIVAALLQTAPCLLTILQRPTMPSVNLPFTTSPKHADLTLNIQGNRRHSVPDRHYRSSSRGPHRASHYSNRDHHYSSHRRESLGERIKRFFGIGTHRVRFVDSSGHEVDRLGRPVYAL